MRKNDDIGLGINDYYNFCAYQMGRKSIVETAKCLFNTLRHYSILHVSIYICLFPSKRTGTLFDTSI